MNDLSIRVAAAARLLLALFFPPLLFFMAGPIRYETGLGLGISYLISIVPFSLLAFALWRERRRFRPGVVVTLVVGGAFLGLCAYATRLLFNPYLDGMMNAHGVDAGFHIVLHNHFRTMPKLYGGGVGLLAVTNAATRLGASNSFIAFRLVFYGSVFAVLGAAVAAAALVNASTTLGSRGRLCALVAAVVIAVPATRFVLLPILHEIQADGFFPEVFAMAPLALGWIAYAVAERPWLRVSLLAATCVVTRYSYGLNFSDLAWTSAALALAEWRGLASRRLRAIVLLLALGLVGAGIVVLKVLYPILPIYGYLLQYRYFVVAPTELALLGFVAAAPRALRQLGVELDGSGMRVLRFVVVFAGFNLALEALYQLAGQTPSYYFHKHVYACVILLTAASVAATATLVGACIERAGHVGWGTLPPLFLALFVVGVLPLGFYYGFDEYEVTMTERAYGKPPFARLEPLYDPTAQQFIVETLNAAHKPFAAYITDTYALTTFMSYVNGAEEGVNVNDYVSEPMIFRDDPGYCYFWTEPPLHQPFERQIEKLRTHGPRCVEHHEAWAPSKRQQLCGVCY